MARKVEQIDAIDRLIGARIQELRLAKGMSRHQLAEMIGVTHQQLQKYEKGINRISAGRLAMIAKALAKSVSYFYEDTEGENTTVPTQHQRMCIEVSRNFMRIKNANHQEAVNTLVRTLADNPTATGGLAQL